jgi:hypothetical protein
MTLHICGDLLPVAEDKIIINIPEYFVVNLIRQAVFRQKNLLQASINILKDNLSEYPRKLRADYNSVSLASI